MRDGGKATGEGVSKTAMMMPEILLFMMSFPSNSTVFSRFPTDAGCLVGNLKIHAESEGGLQCGAAGNNAGIWPAIPCCNVGSCLIAQRQDAIRRNCKTCEPAMRQNSQGWACFEDLPLRFRHHPHIVRGLTCPARHKRQDRSRKHRSGFALCAQTLLPAPASKQGRVAAVLSDVSMIANHAHDKNPQPPHVNSASHCVTFRRNQGQDLLTWQHSDIDESWFWAIQSTIPPK
ncbi:MAG: hypothetical protein R3D29_03220 [Nitratireductor sp.]